MRRELDRKTKFAWRPAPFGRGRKVLPAEAARWRELDSYAVYPRQGTRRDWTHEEINRLVTLLDQGYGYSECAHRLGRTRSAVWIKVKKLRCALTKRPTVLTARDVARLLGKQGSEKAIARWIRGGLLQGRVVTTGTRRIWRVCYDDLMRFLRDERSWPLWEAARVTDDDLRAEMCALRAHEGRYLTQGEVAARYHIGVAAVGQWLDKGWLPYVHCGGDKGNRVVRECDLAGWVPPCERSKAGIPKRMGRCVVGHTAIVGYERHMELAS